MNIFRADMRRIPFAADAFSFVLAYESIFFLTKQDIATTMPEIERVLKPTGSCFEIKSVDDSKRVTSSKPDTRAPLGSPGFTYHEDGEADRYFNRFHVLHRKKRIRKTLMKGEKGQRVYMDYIAKKT